MRNKKKRDTIFNSTPNQSILSTGKSFRTIQRYKKKSFEEQFKRLDFLFNKGIYTMKQASVILDIDRSNICRYVGKRKKNSSIYFVRFGICPITKTSGVGFYTINKDIFNNTLNSINNGK